MKAIYRLISVLLTLFTAAWIQGAETITIRSTPALETLSHQWAQAYMRKNPGVNIQVTSSATDAAFAALERKETEVATVPRHIHYPEVRACIQALGKRPAEYKAGISGVAVYVNSKNPIENLTLDDLADLYAGKVTNWKSLGGEDVPVSLYGTGEHSAAYETFKYEVLYRKQFTSNLHREAAAAIVPSVAGNAGAIGFCPLAQGKGVRALGVKRAPSSTPVRPSAKTIVDRTYPIMQYFYNYVNPAANQGAVKGYVEWIASDAGQKFIQPPGCYPLPPELRTK
jgi:phosphate transport system substrate-binding protein